VKYSANYQNGGNARFEWDGDPTDEEQLDDLLEAAYDAAPGGLCPRCARDFDISEDIEVYEIRETESRKVIFQESTWDDRLRADLSRTHAENNELRLEVINARKQRDALMSTLREAGFTVDPDTFAVSH
jgi:FtsZ-binding cell division protein ZapB